MNLVKEELSQQLKKLNLTTMQSVWESYWEKAVQEDWSGLQYLNILCEHELASRAQRKLKRHLLEAKLPLGKGLEHFDYSLVHGLSRQKIMDYSSGNGWLKEKRNLLIFGPSGVGKTHLAAGIGEKLVECGYRVHFSRTTELIEKLQQSKAINRLSDAIGKLDKYDCLILDDFGYVKKDQQETNILFELICERYERKSLLITCNQPFSEWETIFSDARTATAATDRIIHEALLIQINGDSYRRTAALAKLRESSKDAQKVSP